MLARAASALQRLAARPAPLPQVRSISLNRVRKYRNIEKKENKKFVCLDDPEDEIPIEQYANKIDTTLTPEQKEYVDKLKKKMNGANSPRCKYFLSFVISLHVLVCLYTLFQYYNLIYFSILLTHCLCSLLHF